jgi:urease accessory protein
VSVAALLLGDSRFPAGGHAHSGGVEPAVTAGTVTGLRTLEVFLRGRLQTAGLVAAGIAAAACAHARAGAPVPDRAGRAGSRDATGGPGPAGGATRDAGSGLPSEQGNGARGESAALVRDDGFWPELDAEADARTPALAQREAARRQGRALLRAAQVAWPQAQALASLAAFVAAGSARTTSAAPAEYRGGPHHAVVLGAAAAAAGCLPLEASRIAAYQAVAGPASAAVRLLALDPMKAAGILAGLAGDIDHVAVLGAGYADGPLGDLPCPSAPALDLLAQAHVRAEARLFES